MENSKLIALLRSLNNRERRSFRDLVASPYFNRNVDVLRLADWLEGFAPAFEGVTRAAAQRHLFGTDGPDEARLNHLMSFLLNLAEDFIGLELYRKEPHAHDRHVLQALEVRHLEKHYRYNLEKARNAFDDIHNPAADHFFNRFALEAIESEHFTRSSPRQFNESVQIATDNLDTFYLLAKLRRTCYMYTSQAILATPYNLQLVEEICRFVAAHAGQLASPAIEGYFRVYRLLVEDDPHGDFQALKALLTERSAGINEIDLSDIYQYAINFCNLQINKAREQYIQEAFDLYLNGLDSGILLSGGALSPWHFKNIINLSLKLKNYRWAEQFIVEKNALLPADFQQDALHYNLAQLYYNTGRLSEAMNHLNRMEFTDIHYSLGAKFMLCQIYFQNDHYDALESMLNAFAVFLRRNRLIAEQTRQAFLNFIGIMKKIQRAPWKQYGNIRQQVEAMTVLAGKEWLLNVLAAR